MWLKTAWMGHPMRIELTCAGLLDYLANQYTTQGALDDLIGNIQWQLEVTKQFRWGGRGFVIIILGNLHTVFNLYPNVQHSYQTFWKPKWYLVMKHISLIYLTNIFQASKTIFLCSLWLTVLNECIKIWLEFWKVYEVQGSFAGWQKTISKVLLI